MSRIAILQVFRADDELRHQLLAAADELDGFVQAAIDEENAPQNGVGAPFIGTCSLVSLILHRVVSMESVNAVLCFEIECRVRVAHAAARGYGHEAATRRLEQIYFLIHSAAIAAGPSSFTQQPQWSM